MSTTSLNEEATEKKKYNFCSLQELKKQKCVNKWVEEMRDEIIALYIDDEIHVMSSVCPHYGGDFKYDCKKKKLECKWHGFIFDGKSGKIESPSSMKMSLRRYSFEIVNDTIEVHYI